jgi:hypothetical protein
MIQVDETPSAEETLADLEKELESLRNGGECCPWLSREESIEYLTNCINRMKETT